MKLIILTLFTTLCFSCSSSNDIEHYEEPISGTLPYIIVVGQSNAEGFAPQSTAPDWLLKNDGKLDNYLMWNKTASFFSTYQLGLNVGSENNADKRFGFDVFFAKKYIEYKGGKLLCIKQALSGTPISIKGATVRGRWNTDTLAVPEGERRMYSEFLTKLTEVKNYAKKQNVKLVPVAVLLHQGEADSNENQRLAEYKTNLLCLIAALRNSVGKEHLLVINADILPIKKNAIKVNLIYKEIEKEDPYFKTVDMSEHQTNIGDNLHYDAAAFEYMGNSMFDYYKK